MAKKRKQKINRYFILFGVLFLLLLAYPVLVYLSQMREKKEAEFALYPGFDIQLPVGYAIHGIDVSNHQDYIDWSLVQQMQVQDVRIGFVFIKATEGLSSVDKQFARNWQLAKQSGIPRGAYHFFIATKSGIEQAENFIHTVQLEPGDLPPVLDIEQLYGANPDSMRLQVKAFLETVEAAYKVKPIIYSYADFYVQNLGKEFDGYPLWVAHYNLEKDKEVVVRDWVFWQHNKEGHVNGIVPKVDFDVFSGDSSDFKQLLLK